MGPAAHYHRVWETAKTVFPSRQRREAQAGSWGAAAGGAVSEQRGRAQTHRQSKPGWRGTGHHSVPWRHFGDPASHPVPWAALSWGARPGGRRQRGESLCLPGPLESGVPSTQHPAAADHLGGAPQAKGHDSPVLGSGGQLGQGHTWAWALQEEDGNKAPYSLGDSWPCVEAVGSPAGVGVRRIPGSP